MSRDLTRIRTDLELHEKPGDLLQAEPDVPELRTWYEKLEANRLLATLQESSPVEAAIPEPAADADYETVLERERLDAWIKKLEKAKLVTFDTETTSLDYMQAELVGLSFAVREGEACYIPVAHSDPDTPRQLDRDAVLKALKPILEDPKKPKLGQHLKYDMNVLANYGIHVEGVAFDTMLESYVYNSVATRHDMDSLAKVYLDYSTIKFEEVAGKGAKQLTFDQVPLEQAAPYAAEDADITLRLHDHLWPMLKKQKGPASVFTDIEMPLVPVLSRIERTGVRIDSKMLAKQSKRMAGRMAELEEEAYGIAGRPFNMASPKQIGQIFFEEPEDRLQECLPGVIVAAHEGRADEAMRPLDRHGDRPVVGVDDRHHGGAAGSQRPHDRDLPPPITHRIVDADQDTHAGHDTDHRR